MLVRSLGRVAAIGAFALVFGYGLLGLAVQTAEAVPLPRVLQPAPGDFDARWFNPGAGGVRFHPDWLWELRPGAHILQLDVNDDGYCGPIASTSRGETFRIAVLSDAFALALGLAQEVAWPRLLESLLRTNGIDAEVLNFAVPAFTVAQGRRLYGGRVREYAPDLVIAAFGAVQECEPATGGGSDLVRLERARKWRTRSEMFLERSSTLRWCLRKLGLPRPPRDVGDVRRLSRTEFAGELSALAADVRSDGHRVALVSPPRLQLLERDRPELSEYDHVIHRVARERAIALVEVHDKVRSVQPDVDTPDHLPLGDRMFHDAHALTNEGSFAYAALVARSLVEHHLVPVAENGGGELR